MADYVRISIQTPLGACHGPIPDTATVQETIDRAAESRGVDRADVLELYHGEVRMEPERTLAGCGIGEGAELELVATGRIV